MRFFPLKAQIDMGVGYPSVQGNSVRVGLWQDLMVPFSPRSAARWLLRQPIVGSLVSTGLRGVGAVYLGRRVALLNGVKPDEIAHERLPEKLFAERTISMFTVDGRDQVAMQMWSRGWAAFEEPLPEVFSASVRDGAVVIDVGANTGFYALLAASVGSEVDVRAFEPYPPVADLLDANLRLCQQGARVRAIREAISDEAGETELYVPIDDHGLVEASASLVAEFRDEHSEILKVPVTTIDKYVRSCGLTRVDVIKIDVEGLEDKVLAGAREVLHDMRPVVFLEVLDTPQWKADCARLDEIRQGADYVSVRLDPDALVQCEEVALAPRARNQALWPTEKLQALGEVAERSGYPLRRA